MSAGATEPHCDNPAFNPEAEIKFTIPVATTIVVETLHAMSLPTAIKIYDVLSREVAILDDGEQLTGNCSVSFNAPEFSWEFISVN